MIGPVKSFGFFRSYWKYFPDMGFNSNLPTQSRHLNVEREHYFIFCYSDEGRTRFRCNGQDYGLEGHQV